MRDTITTSFQAQIIEDMHLSLTELCRACAISETEAIVWVSEGVIEPLGQQPDEWQFAGSSLRRARTARRLARDFEINASGIALALDLLEEIRNLRAQLERMR